MINAGIPLPSQPGSALRAKTETFPTVWRNLSLAYFNKMNRPDEAVALLEKASAWSHGARVLMELDQLYKRLNRPHIERLCFLEQHIDIVMTRDDLYLEYVTLLNQTGQYGKQPTDRPKKIPSVGRRRSKVPAQYQLARLELAKELINRKKYDDALALIDECYIYPTHLGEGKLPGAQENDFNYYKAYILQQQGKPEEASQPVRQSLFGKQPASRCHVLQRPETG